MAPGRRNPNDVSDLPGSTSAVGDPAWSAGLPEAGPPGGRSPQDAGSRSRWAAVGRHLQGRWPELLLLAALATGLLALRPHDPFEWDEVLYLRALEHYDVSKHSPHPPGAPAYVAAGTVFRLLVRDPVFALQLLSIVSALASVALLWRLVTRQSGRRAPAVGAAIGLAVMPGFLFYGNVGLTDMPGVAATLATLLLAAVAVERPVWLPPVSVAASLTLAIRPHLLLALAPVGVAVIVAMARRRAWRHLVRALAVGVVASLAFWLPAILLTGWKAYFTTLSFQARWVAVRDAQYAFPAAPLSDVVTHWLVAPMGKWELALPFYILVCTGAVAWWRRDARRLVLVAAGSAVVFLVGSACSLTDVWGVRYGLPSLPFLTALAAGNFVWEKRWLRFVAILASCTIATLLLGWSRGTLLRRLSPAPIWGGMQYIRSHYQPEKTTVVVGSGLGPYADYLLFRAGFATRGDTTIWRPKNRERLPEDEVFVGCLPLPGMVTEWEATWHAPRLEQLSCGRSQRCLVQRLPDAHSPRFSPAWQVRNDGWLVWGKGTISLSQGSPSRQGSLCVKNGHALVTFAGHRPHPVGPGECVQVLLEAGPTGRVTVAPDKDWVILLPFELSRTTKGDSASS
jgi:hypothetical protein